MSLFQEDFVLRLPDDTWSRLLRSSKTKAAQRKWIGEALAYAQTLPPKVKKAAKAKKAKSTRARRG